MLDWPASALARIEEHAPALARLLAAATAPRRESDGELAVACRACGIARQVDWPVAPWLARAAGIDVGHAYWLVADPAHFSVEASAVRLGGIVRDLDRRDADALVARLNAHFAPDGLAFFAPTPARWFVSAEPPPRIATHPPEVARAASLLAYQLAGADAGSWRRWQNELQMLFFEHPVNQRREASGQPPVAGVWLWGGGTLGVSAAPRARIFAEGGLVALLAGSAAAALPEAFAALPPLPHSVVWLRALPGEAAATALASIDRAWMAPAEAALHGGALRELELVLTGRALSLAFRATRPSLRQRWRRLLARRQPTRELARLVLEAATN